MQGRPEARFSRSTRKAPARLRAASVALRSSTTQERSSGPAESRGATPVSRVAGSPATRPPTMRETSASVKPTRGEREGRRGRPGARVERFARATAIFDSRLPRTLRLLGGSGRGSLGSRGASGRSRRGRLGNRHGRVENLQDLVGDVYGIVGVDQARLELVEDDCEALLLADLVDHREDALLEIGELLLLSGFEIAVGVILEPLE